MHSIHGLQVAFVEHENQGQSRSLLGLNALHHPCLESCSHTFHSIGRDSPPNPSCPSHSSHDFTNIDLQSDAPIPLIPPPPAPLNIPPSRARRQLAARLALQKQRADEAAIAGEEAAARSSQDPFASLGDRDDDGNGSDPFTLDEEEEDITTSGRRAKKPQDKLTPAQKFSVSRGIQSLFSGYPSTSPDEDIEDEPLGRALSPPSDEAEEGSASDNDDDNDDDPGQPSEAATTPGRKPLEIDEEDDEMGEMVAPSEEAEVDDDDEDADPAGPNSSDEDELEESEALSPIEKERLRGNFSGTQLAPPAPLPARLHQRGKSLEEERPQDDDTDDSGEGMVEIAMPKSAASKAAK